MNLLILPHVDLTRPDVVVGRHAAWLPPEVYRETTRASGEMLSNDWHPAAGLKIPFQHCGELVKYTCPREARYPVFPSLQEEMALLTVLALRAAAPPVLRPVLIRSLTSGFDRPAGCTRTDRHGVYAYEMVDATTLPPGRHQPELLDGLPITGSPSAFGDLRKPGNTVNGYLVDVRRSAFDMLRWTGPLPAFPYYRVEADDLVQTVRRLCQFPAGARPEPYQDFYLPPHGWHRGARRVAERALALGFHPAPGESVLDVGCQSGGFLQWAALEQERAGSVGRLLGIDVVPEYLDCARKLAAASAMPVEYRHLDVAADLAAMRTLAAGFPGGRPDHLLLLSMEKHMPAPAFWALIDGIAARRTYVETNAYRGGGDLGGKQQMEEELLARGALYLGDSSDRNPRRLYRLERRSD